MMFPERLRELRKKHKLTMKEFGKRFNLAESTISGYENGNRKPDLNVVEEFADYFEVSVDFLLGRTDDSTPVLPETNYFMERISRLNPEQQEEMHKLISTFDSGFQELALSRSKPNKPVTADGKKGDLIEAYLQRIGRVNRKKDIYSIAYTYFNNGEYNDAIINAILSFEIFLGQVLRKSLLATGMPEDMIIPYLSTPGNSSVSTRVDDIFNQIVKHDLLTEPAYEPFKKALNIRNLIFHTDDYVASKEQANQVLDAVKNMTNTIEEVFEKFIADKENNLPKENGHFK